MRYARIGDAFEADLLQAQGREVPDLESEPQADDLEMLERLVFTLLELSGAKGNRELTLYEEVALIDCGIRLREALAPVLAAQEALSFEPEDNGEG